MLNDIELCIIYFEVNGKSLQCIIITFGNHYRREKQYINYNLNNSAIIHLRCIGATVANSLAGNSLTHTYNPTNFRRPWTDGWLVGGRCRCKLRLYSTREPDKCCVVQCGPPVWAGERICIYACFCVCVTASSLAPEIHYTLRSCVWLNNSTF